jgi:hypothetical protein
LRSCRKSPPTATPADPFGRAADLHVTERVVACSPPQSSARSPTGTAPAAARGYSGRAGGAALYLP